MNIKVIGSGCENCDKTNAVVKECLEELSEATVYSQNAPMNHEMNDTAKKQYNLLLDIIDLCAIYY